MSDAAKFSFSERQTLAALHAIGGGAKLDQFSRLLMTDGRVLPGNANQWLSLVAKGAVAGEFGRIILTEAGRAAIA